MSKYPKKPHRGVWVDPNWGWKPPVPIYEGPAEREFKPSVDVPGYWRLTEEVRKSEKSMDSLCRYIASRVVNGKEITPEDRKRYWDTWKQYQRSHGIMQQVYDAYSGEDE